MPKAFLSHSSKDKESYVEIVARQLGFHNCIYDDQTFEEGMKTFEEIEQTLNKTDIFVLFLSDTALQSNWVKKELSKAYDILKNGQLKRIFPIIIDEKITHADTRIPKWMRDEYNLKLIKRPSVATRRIKQRLREIRWENHPRLKEKDEIFVGRNNLVKVVEERLDSFDKPTCTCLIATGIDHHGRKALMKYCLHKSNITSDSYLPATISLNSHESLEDFIYKIYDLGFSNHIDLTHFLSKTVEEKTEIALKLIRDIQQAKEIIFINDRGCIVKPDCTMIGWFGDILKILDNSDRITFGVASTYRLFKNRMLDLRNVFIVEVPELEIKERAGLLKRYAQLEGLDLSNEDFVYFLNLLNGFPEQVFYTVELIKDIGLTNAKSNSHLIVDFNTERLSYLLEKYEKEEWKINFLFFLSQFEFVHYNYVFEIVEEKTYSTLLNEFFASAICEHLGANKEYIRVNDVIRGYVSRNRVSLPDDYKEKMKKHLNEFLKTYKYEEKDAADLFSSMKQALIEGKDIDEKYLIPSHFLKTMKELYDEHKRYDEVISLADRVLEKSEFMDKQIEFQIRFYLCQSLAKRRNHRFLEEVQKIHGAEHNFLMGFYYRLNENNIKAMEQLEIALKERPDFPRANRELVQVLIYIGDFEKALDLAKENYENNKTNPYHIHAYFRCLINTEKTQETEVILKDLLYNFSKIKSKKAKEMFLESQAQYYAFYENDEKSALELIDQAIFEFSDVIYTYLTKFDICEGFNNVEGMKEVIDYFDENIDEKSYYYNTTLSKKAIYLSRIGKVPQALRIVNNQIRNYYPNSAKEKLIDKIERFRNN